MISDIVPALKSVKYHRVYSCWQNMFMTKQLNFSFWNVPPISFRIGLTGMATRHHPTIHHLGYCSDVPITLRSSKEMVTVMYWLGSRLCCSWRPWSSMGGTWECVSMCVCAPGSMYGSPSLGFLTIICKNRFTSFQNWYALYLRLEKSLEIINFYKPVFQQVVFWYSTVHLSDWSVWSSRWLSARKM